MANTKKGLASTLLGKSGGTSKVSKVQKSTSSRIAKNNAQPSKSAISRTLKGK